jgi:flavin reductase (DIM6/NTAB) family NADH-FMN oxidoreductase RutF
MTSMTLQPQIQSTINAVSDLRAFRKCLGHYGTGVAVVAAKNSGQQRGMTINSFSALSLSPPLVMWSIRNESSARDFFTTAPYFSVNVLSADQLEISGRFAKSDGDPFAPGGWTEGEHGVPLLEGVSATLSCSLHQIVMGGDHTIIIGLVVSYAHFDRTPLLFVQGEYRVSTLHPQSRAISPPPTGSGGIAGASLMRLFSTLSSQWIDEFDIDGVAENLSRSQSRVLAWLSDSPRTLDSLQINIGFTDGDLQDDVLSLIGLGYAFETDVKTFALTPLGHAKREDLAARIRQFEDIKLARFEPSKIVALRQILEDLLQK